MSEQLRLGYSKNTRRETSAALDHLVRITGWPRHVFKQEAQRQGWIRTGQRRAWTAGEIDYLRERIGVFSLAHIARSLSRNLESVSGKAEKLHLSRKARAGYNLCDLQGAFGVGPERVRSWVSRGLFGKTHQHGLEVRMAEANVIRFLREHASEYDLRRVDQQWYKSVLFGELANYGDHV